MEYKDFFSPKTLEKLNTKSAENLKTMLGDKSLMQTIMSSSTLMNQISKAEAPYKTQLEKLAVDMVKELYPIIDEEGITLDAKIDSISNIGQGLDEIKVNKPGTRLKIRQFSKDSGWVLDKDNPWGNWKELFGKEDFAVANAYLYKNYAYLTIHGVDNLVESLEKLKDALTKRGIPNQITTHYAQPIIKISSKYYDLINLHHPNINESITPESRRRIINAITQGAALRGTFAFYLFKEHLDDLDPTLVNNYNQIMKNSFGIYDDENAIAMMLAALAQGQKMAGGSSKVIINEIKINQPNPLNYLLSLQSKIKATDDPLEKLSLAIQCAERVLFIFEEKFPDDKRPRKAIEAAKVYLANPTEENKKATAAAAADAYAADAAAAYAINAVKKYYNLNEIRVNEPDFFYPIVNSDTNINYDNLIKNIKIHKNKIQSKLGITDKDKLNELLTFYINTYTEVEHQGDEDLYIDMSLEDFIEDIKGFYEGSTEEDWAPDPTYDVVTIKDILESSLNEAESGITIQARAANFPMLVHELIKGLYELLSLQGFKGDKTSNQAVADKVDLLKNEPSDIRYGKFIFDALNKVFINSEYNDPRIREFFLTEIYQLDDEGFIQFIENAVNDELTQTQTQWANSTLRDIASDLKADDYESTGLDEIRVIPPGQTTTEDVRLFIKDIFDNDPTYFHEKALPTIKKYFKSTPWNIDNLPPTDKKLFLIDLKKLFGTQPLNEYSEKTINTTIERWKATDPETDENTAKQLIQRFDQIKSGLSSKLNVVSLSDTLKQGQNYLNIDKYSFEDMVKLIQSLPENPEKAKKDAIGRFVQRDGIDKTTAQSYVARFISKKDELKYAVENGTEDGSFTKEEVKNFIPKKLLNNNAYLDPRVWGWVEFEQMLDALFPSQRAAGDEGENLVSTDADKIYDKGGIEIYKGDDVHKCISYNPTSAETKRKKYGWCVTQVGNTNYDYYRFRDKSPTFYFVFDRSKDSSPEHATFNDEWHAFVVQVNSDGESYIVTGANNRGDITANSWEGISKIVPSETWAKIKGLKDYFKPINLSAVERGRKFASGKNLSLNEFKELAQDEKILYIQGKASKNEISNEILEILPQYKINLEGRSTTLANIAIDSGQIFPYSTLKNNEALAKRYAIFRFRHTDYSKNPIPLPYVKYLDDEAKQKYLDTFDDNLTFEYIEKYFGQTATENYVNEQVKKLDYLPKSAVKYIKNPKLKTLFEIYSKLFNSWEFGSNTNLSDEALESAQNMPEQDVNPIPINLKQWLELSPQEKKIIIELTEKYNQNPNYSTLAYASPFIIKDGAETYILLPGTSDNYNYTDWVLLDKNNNVIKKLPEGTSLGGMDLISGYPTAEDNFKRVWNLKDLKIEK